MLTNKKDIQKIQKIKPTKNNTKKTQSKWLGPN